MTFPPLDEQSSQRRAAVYGRANQASVHYRPLRKGRPVPAPDPAPTSRAAKTANQRRFVLFAVALLLAIAFGTAIFGVVLASPAPIAQAPPAPTREVPEPPIQPLPLTGRGVPAEMAPPPATRSDPSTGTTAPHRTGTGPSAAGGGGEAAPPATSSTVYYQNCNKARRAGAAPLYPGDPGYSDKLDKDGNGIACDEKDVKSDTP
ncbi:excalibur calcium-binding domain-containing protein [Phytohabitans suffuscus]|uniref:Excalibur calcium-binding domain-containing protein n=1 Tax=Phytohabitans suffuscus TaxID=624315 RepID=A0A6F8YH16_9ACTN|nr:excalibur calcium-binding domain-containing protein [Phytohabitans suffuscus]BCB85392.1 hypothetical protein Psuf_027050 [Phytohabitans suffuscus]